MKFNKSEILTLSNFLSFLRMLLVIPLWIILDESREQWTRNIAALICIFAAITDILDGYFARKFNQITEFGKIIDPLADKIIVGAVVIKLFLIGDIPGYYFYMIIIRDILILIGGIIITKMIDKVLPSNVLGKITVIMISLVLLFELFMVGERSWIYLFVFYSSIALIIISFIAYAYRGIEFVRKSET